MKTTKKTKRQSRESVATCRRSVRNNPIICKRQKPKNIKPWLKAQGRASLTHQGGARCLIWQISALVKGVQFLLWMITFSIGNRLNLLSRISSTLLLIQRPMDSKPLKLSRPTILSNFKTKIKFVMFPAASTHGTDLSLWTWICQPWTASIQLPKSSVFKKKSKGRLK